LWSFTVASNHDHEADEGLVRELKHYLLPAQDAIRCGTLTVSGCFLPASECGGDWWTVHEFPDGKMLVLISDVAGHGVGSAKIMGIGKAVCDLVCMDGQAVGPAELLGQLNQAIVAAGRRRGFMMTSWVAVIDPARYSIVFSTAGHTLPYLIRTSGGGCELLSLLARGPTLGMDETAQFKDYELDLSPGDMFFLYTDGVTECMNPEGEMFGERRLRKILLANARESAQRVRDEVIEQLKVFRRGAELPDDLTFVVGKLDV
jgi:phosphoserine phosphatase RsbU/P